MLKQLLSVTVLMVLAINVANAEVYLAQNGDDIQYFLSRDSSSNIALLFFDEVQEVAQKDVAEASHKLEGIFLKKGQEGRSTEEWVDTLNDSVNMMKIDAFNKENTEMVKTFNIKETPFLILYENGKIALETKVDKDTTQRVKDILYKPPVSPQQSPAQQSSAPGSTNNQPQTQSTPTSTSTPSPQPTTNQPAAQTTPQESPSSTPTNNQQPAQQSAQPSQQPSQPAAQPAAQPSSQPASQPTAQPSSQPAAQQPQQQGTQPATQPSSQPSTQPAQPASEQSSATPASQPAQQPTTQEQPAQQPTTQPGTLGTMPYHKPEPQVTDYFIYVFGL